MAACLAASSLLLWSCGKKNDASDLEEFQSRSGSFIDQALTNAHQIISELSLKEKLAQLQSGSIYVIKDASDSLGNLNFDTLRTYYP
ncbi:MAG: hypothetical protein IJ150_12650, partial [Bacteroidales bacterium]|nr:hypothetical protein [Bacteroidales bacterium]